MRSRLCPCPDPEGLPACRAVLMEKPDVVVGTPSRILNHLQQDSLKLRDSLELLVMDEADLLFSFGFEEELKSLLWYARGVWGARVDTWVWGGWPEG